MGRSTCIRPLASNTERFRKRETANLQHVCQSQFQGLASACAVLLSHARSIWVVEKPDFAHARARVRYPLDKVLGIGGDFAFRGLSAQREAQRRESCRQAFDLKDIPRAGLPMPSAARAWWTPS